MSVRNSFRRAMRASALAGIALVAVLPLTSHPANAAAPRPLCSAVDDLYGPTGDTYVGEIQTCIVQPEPNKYQAKVIVRNAKASILELDSVTVDLHFKGYYVDHEALDTFTWSPVKVQGFSSAEVSTDVTPHPWTLYSRYYGTSNYVMYGISRQQKSPEIFGPGF